MAHEFATTNGRTAMMYAGEIPWHGLGTRLDEPPTAGEAIEAAGLNYQADLIDIETTDGIPIPQRKAVIRSDSGDVLGVVGTRYVPVQNHHAFGFLDAVGAAALDLSSFAGASLRVSSPVTDSCPKAVVPASASLPLLTCPVRFT